MKLIYKLIVIVIYKLIVISNKADLQAHCNSLDYGFHLQFEDAQAALQQVPMLMMII